MSYPSVFSFFFLTQVLKHCEFISSVVSYSEFHTPLDQITLCAVLCNTGHIPCMHNKVMKFISVIEIHRYEFSRAT